MRNAPIGVVADVIVAIGIMLGSSLRTPILADVVIDVDAVLGRVFEGVPAKAALEVLWMLCVSVDPVDGRMRCVLLDPLFHPLLILFAGWIAFVDGATRAKIWGSLNAATEYVGNGQVMHSTIVVDVMYFDD